MRLCTNAECGFGAIDCSRVASGVVAACQAFEGRWKDDKFTASGIVPGDV
jgi:hypothetical protein